MNEFSLSPTDVAGWTPAARRTVTENTARVIDSTSSTGHQNRVTTNDLEETPTEETR